MKAIYKFHFDCGRQGELTGIFVAEVAKMNGLIQSGAIVHFGEVLGKHSEIYGPIEGSDITMVSDDKDFVALFEKHDMATGCNPFDYITEEAD